MRLPPAESQKRTVPPVGFDGPAANRVHSRRLPDDHGPVAARWLCPRDRATSPARRVGTARAASDPKPVPHFTETSFIAADGQILPLRKWLPQSADGKSEVKAVILAFTGLTTTRTPSTGQVRSGPRRAS